MEQALKAKLRGVSISNIQFDPNRSPPTPKAATSQIGRQS